MQLNKRQLRVIDLKVCKISCVGYDFKVKLPAHELAECGHVKVDNC